MRHRLSIAMGLFLGVLLTLSVLVEAQQKGPTTKQDRVEGTVHMIDKDTKTITVNLRAKTLQRQVVYNEATKFTYRNKSASLDEVKDGRRVICVGQFNDKTQLMATRIDVRDSQ